ncbi:MAG: hypothetical protein LBS90_07245 [Oscillospiraceae bacterium]|jgi:hypothetical protein|nr:hypothetical protein [Oscillospiraceae bacterium]
MIRKPLAVIISAAIALSALSACADTLPETELPTEPSYVSASPPESAAPQTQTPDESDAPPPSPDASPAASAEPSAEPSGAASPSAQPVSPSPTAQVTPPAASPTPAPTPSDSPELAAIYSRVDGAVATALDKWILPALQENGSAVTYGFEKHDYGSALTGTAAELYGLMRVCAYDFRDFEISRDEYGADAPAAAEAAYFALTRDELDLSMYFALEAVTSGGAVTGYRSLYFLPGSADKRADRASIERELEKTRLAAERIVAQMPENLSAYDRYRYLAMTLTLLTAYDHSHVAGYSNMSPYGGLILGKTICSGYSRSYQYLCREADLWCLTVDGSSRGANGEHMWNLVTLAAGTYYVDVTWSDDDPVGKTRWNRYFMVTQAVILIDHVIYGGVVATGV